MVSEGINTVSKRKNMIITSDQVNTVSKPKDIIFYKQELVIALLQNLNKLLNEFLFACQRACSNFEFSMGRDVKNELTMELFSLFAFLEAVISYFCSKIITSLNSVTPRQHAFTFPCQSPCRPCVCLFVAVFL
jgi:hypothetical protein